MNNNERPLGITIIALFSYFGAIISLIFIGFQFEVGLIRGIWNIIRIVFLVFAGYGLWNLKSWGAYGSIFAYTIIFVGNLVISFATGINPPDFFLSLFLLVVIMYYLYTKQHLFGN